MIDVVWLTIFIIIAYALLTVVFGISWLFVVLFLVVLGGIHY